MVSFDSDHSGGDGASFFFLGEFFLCPVCLGCLERVFLLALLISGVVDFLSP